jgi:hypothetical protein
MYGWSPGKMVATVVRVARSSTVTLSPLKLATYAREPSGRMVMPAGSEPTDNASTTVALAVSTTATLSALLRVT